MSFCTVYYLKATFGSGVSEAVLRIPVSVTGNKFLRVDYQITSPRLELVVLFDGGNNLSRQVIEYASQSNRDGWSYINFPVDSDVEAVRLVANKTGVTTNVEYVLVRVKIVSDRGKGNMPLLFYRRTVYLIGKVSYSRDDIAKCRTFYDTMRYHTLF